MHKLNIHIKKSILMMVLISGLLAIPSCIYLEDLGLFRRRSLKRALEWAKQDSIRVADSLKRFELVKNSDEVIPGDSLEDKRGKNGFFESIKTKHYIIVGSFTNASNAGLCARKYLSKGFKTETIIRNGSNIELVSVRSFENILDAKKYLSEFQHDVDSAAWVYSQN